MKKIMAIIFTFVGFVFLFELLEIKNINAFCGAVCFALARLYAE